MRQQIGVCSIPAATGAAFGSGDESPWIDLGNGFLSSAANNVLNLNLSFALTGGVVNVIACGARRFSLSSSVSLVVKAFDSLAERQRREKSGQRAHLTVEFGCYRIPVIERIRTLEHAVIEKNGKA